jgi:hypothetical protein
MIARLDTVQDVKGFLDGREEKLLFCLDQYQELELEPEAKKELDARLYQFRTIVVTSAGGEELTRENDTLHQQASMFPVHDGLTQVCNQGLLDHVTCSCAPPKSLSNLHVLDESGHSDLVLSE